MPRLLIAIYDRIANDIIGPIVTYNNPAPAMRMFQDVAADERSQVHQHVGDYELWKLGTLDENTLTIIPEREVLLTGTQLEAMTAAQTAKAHLNNADLT